tara:strand:- start:54799 stop:54999 length:201 start_codon:yes stop_codon:yes gene_type:complete
MAIYKKAPFKKVTQLLNSSVAKLIASKEAGKIILDKNYADDTAAKAAGLTKGDIYQKAGTVKVVQS